MLITPACKFPSLYVCVHDDDIVGKVVYCTNLLHTCKLKILILLPK